MLVMEMMVEMAGNCNGGGQCGGAGSHGGVEGDSGDESPVMWWR